MRLPDDWWLEGVLLRLCRAKFLDDDIRATRDAILQRFAEETAIAAWQARLDENQQYLDLLAETEPDHRPRGLIASSTIKARLSDLKEYHQPTRKTE